MRSTTGSSDVDEAAHEVYILAIGEKERDRLLVAGEDVEMKIASVAEVKSQFSAFVKSSTDGPIVVTCPVNR